MKVPTTSRIVDEPLQEIIVSTPANRHRVHYALRTGTLRKIATGVYTTNLTDPIEMVVQRNVWHIAAGLFPNGLIADRTAIENRPAKDGSVFLVADRVKPFSLPGITFWPRRGVSAISGSDRPFIGGLFMSSPARAVLDNLRSSRERGHLPRTLRREGVERYIESIFRSAGDSAVNRLRDEANKIARDIDREEEAAILSKIVGAMMGTQEAKLHSPNAIARGRGEAYDPQRLELFESLRAELAILHLPERAARERTQYLPFFEAYFSNFIEGTEFVVDEAYKVVYEGLIPPGRPKDAHDIVDTFRIVSDKFESARIAKTPSDFLELLRSHHATLLAGRPEKRPGEFKNALNRAGSTIFVAPDLVRGTLLKGFELLATLQSPMAKAVFATFLVSEVHPFDDGNGRLARIVMNAELSMAGQARIIIPTVFRTEYLQALRGLSHNGVIKGLVRVLDFAQQYVSEISFDEYEAARSQLEQTNAFKDPADATGSGDKLLLPSHLRRT